MRRRAQAWGAVRIGDQNARGFGTTTTVPVMPGWIAQWLEMHGDTDTRIGRPRQIFTGATDRHFVPLSRR